jgi:hypothetical protein
MHGATVIMSADDGSLPGRKEDYEAIVQYRQLFELHNYYEGIKAFTFETIFLPLSVEEVGRKLLFGSDLAGQSLEELQHGY